MLRGALVKRSRESIQKKLGEYKGGLSSKAMREHLRRYSKQGRFRLEQAIDRLREKTHFTRYDDALHALIATAPNEYAQLFQMGQRRFGALAHYGEPFSTLPLESELRWTAQWLNIRAQQITKFREVASGISDLVGDEKYDAALNALTTYRSQVGYSFWQVELEVALVSAHEGPAAAKSLVSTLRKSCQHDSIPGFLAYLIGDRNEEGVTYDAFHARCKESIPRMNIDEWLKGYLLYRALQNYELTPAALGQNLRNERRACIIDLYEGFIETCMTICANHELRNYRKDVLVALDMLGDVVDYRLGKIRLYAGGQWDQGLSCTSNEASSWSDLYPFLLYRGASATKIAATEQRSQIYKDLVDMWDRGSGADKAVERLLKFGINLKSLDIGIALATHAERQSSKTAPLMLIAAGAPLCLKGVAIEEMYGGPVDLSRNLLAEYAAQPGASSEANVALSIFLGKTSDLTTLSSLGRLWIANSCLANGNYQIAERAVDSLNEAGPRWTREATKHQFVSAYTRGDLKAACQVLTLSLTKDRAIGSELPVTEMFQGKKWRDFSSLDPIHVGIAAHFAYDAPPASPVGFILSSSCRMVMKSDIRSVLDGEPNPNMGLQQREQMLLYFEEVWNEDVLSRTGAFETTHDVRVERLNVVRRLLDWDKENEETYRAIIKELTLDETLWQGVKQVNETRVFVNEPAITRWAEKELFDDYKRWIEFLNIDLPTEEVTELKVLEYLSMPMGNLSGVVSLERVTESDAMFSSIVTRLFERFLYDPTDGLNCYLSVRVRHGSLLRALLGPSEAADLLPADSAMDEDGGIDRVTKLTGASWSDAPAAYSALQYFASAFRALGDELVRERVQLVGVMHPKGLIQPRLRYAQVLEQLSRAARLGFSIFLETCYVIFWRSLSDSLEEARTFLATDEKNSITEIFATLTAKLQEIPSVSPQFLAAVTQAATHTRAACDHVSAWFQLPNMRDVLTFDVNQAVEVAKRISQTLYPGYEPRVSQTNEALALPLASTGLSTIVDCLLIVLDNVWEHSSVGDRPEVKLTISRDNNILHLRAVSPIAPSVLMHLQAGGLEEIRQRLESSEHIGLVSKEGGSGLAKLKRLAAVLDPNQQRAFNFGLDAPNSEWFVSLGMRLHAHEGGAYYVH